MKGLLKFVVSIVLHPVGFIGRADDTGVYLTITKDAVARYDWTAPPPTVREHSP